MISLLFQSPLTFFLLAGALIISICIHEFSHAFAADRLGDPTAKYLGRLTLNPKVHLDSVGTLFLLFVGFGWGKPVPFNPLNLRNPKRDAAIISLAGPLSNFILAVILSFPLRYFGMNSLLGIFLGLTVLYNLSLGFFNLIPFGPLDGNKIVYGLLPYRLAYQWEDFQKHGTYILMFLVLTNSTEKILTPLVDTTMRMLGIYLP
ncbi:MAG: site-2 protease family protein [Patescibacteria group bacterium]